MWFWLVSGISACIWRISTTLWIFSKFGHYSPNTMNSLHSIHRKWSKMIHIHQILSIAIEKGVSTKQILQIFKILQFDEKLLHVRSKKVSVQCVYEQLNNTTGTHYQKNNFSWELFCLRNCLATWVSMCAFNSAIFEFGNMARLARFRSKIYLTGSRAAVVAQW